MARTLELFEKQLRAKPRVMMHVIDAGVSHGACNAEGRGEPCIALFKCRKCGHESDWLECDNTTEVKKGIACPICNVTLNVQIEGLAGTERERIPESSKTAGREENAYGQSPSNAAVRKEF